MISNEDFLKAMENRFNVSEDEEIVEMETWTNGGVNMFVVLRKKGKPYIEQFWDHIDDFDIDTEIEVHRENKGYKSAFTISQSLEDFTAYKNWLTEIYEELRG